MVIPIALNLKCVILFYLIVHACVCYFVQCIYNPATLWIMEDKFGPGPQATSLGSDTR